MIESVADAGKLTFECSGRWVRLGTRAISIGTDTLVPLYGWDGGLEINNVHPLSVACDDEMPPMTPAERRELADYAIALWERFAKEGPKE